jgi:RNA recognition motif-containing protein
MVSVNVRIFDALRRNATESAGKESIYIFITNSTHNNMATKLYVGGLPYNTTEDQLRDAFAPAGSVTSAMIIIDKMTNRSKGFGFVEMSSDTEAQAAIDMWNGKDFGGRSLTVNEARPKEDRPRNGGGGDRGGDRGGYGGGNRGGSGGGGRW